MLLADISQLYPKERANLMKEDFIRDRTATLNQFNKNGILSQTITFVKQQFRVNLWCHQFAYCQIPLSIKSNSIPKWISPGHFGNHVSPLIFLTHPFLIYELFRKRSLPTNVYWIELSKLYIQPCWRLAVVIGKDRVFELGDNCLKKK